MPRKPAEKTSRGRTKRSNPKRSVARVSSTKRKSAEVPDTAFIDALSEDFKRFGASAIAEVRQADPVTYMKLCASVLPKSVMGAVDPLDSLSDEELRQRAHDLAKKVGIGLDFAAVGDRPAEEV